MKDDLEVAFFILYPSSLILIHRGVTHPGRTVTVWECGVRRGLVGLTPRPLNIADCRFPIGLSKSMGSCGQPNRQSKIGNRKCFWAGDVTDSIEVLQTSCEGLTPSQSTKLRRSSNG